MIDLNSLSKLDIPSYDVSTNIAPSFINPYGDISINLQYATSNLGKLEASVSQMEAISMHSMKSFNKSPDFKTPDKADRYAKKLCRLIKTIKFLTNITGYMTQWIEELNKLMGWLVSQIAQKLVDIASPVVQYILGWIQIISLKIKKFVLHIKIQIAKFLKKILEGVKNKKGSWASTAIAAAIQGLLTAFKALAQVSYFILLGVDILLKSLPPMITVGEQSMAFFMTPRTIVSGLMKSDINCANANMSIMDRLPAAMCNSLVAMFDAVAKANAAVKISIIAAGAAVGLAAVYNEEFDIPDNICKAMQLLDPKAILEKIDKILKAFAMPYALPKYEELSPATIGYLAFLMTGFCPAGHIAFGFPACP